ncbi:MAG: type II toxin-antitoxin system YhaV family toxin [Burkholderiales bacterium]
MHRRSREMNINGWQLYYFRTFAAALDELEADVAALAKSNPRTYKTHPKTRLLASVFKIITERVPANPDHPEFRLGNTLGRGYGNWRRVKKGMPDRYRLFFRFASNPVKLIVYVWFNDEDTLRKAGSKSDVYETFRRMLARGEVPDGIDELLRESRKPG